MKTSIYKQFLLIGLGASLFVVLSFKLLGSKNNWATFFSKPKPATSKLLSEADPLERTKEIDEQINGSGQFRERKQINLVFSKMCHAVKEEPVSKKDKEIVTEPEPAKPIETKPIKKRCKPAKPLPTIPEENLFPAAYQRNIKSSGIHATMMFTGFIFGDQEVKPGRSLKIVTQDTFIFEGNTIPEGAHLYGPVSFNNERIYVKINTAHFDDRVLPVNIEVYDTDYLPGLLSEHVEAFMERTKKRAMHKASNLSKNEWVRELGSGAIDAIDSIKGKKKIILENRREVFFTLKEKKKKKS